MVASTDEYDLIKFNIHMRNAVKKLETEKDFLKTDRVFIKTKNVL